MKRAFPMAIGADNLRNALAIGADSLWNALVIGAGQLEECLG